MAEQQERVKRERSGEVEFISGEKKVAEPAAVIPPPPPGAAVTQGQGKTAVKPAVTFAQKPKKS
jgi:hypothetical protein